MKTKYTTLFISSIFLITTLGAAPGDVITEDATDPSGPTATVDGDLRVEDPTGNNSVTPPGLYVEGHSNLEGGLMVEGMEMKALYVRGGFLSLDHANVVRVVYYNGAINNPTPYGTISGRGLAVMVIDRVSGEVLEHVNYDVWNNLAERAAMASVLNSLDDSNLVVISSALSWRLPAELKEALLRVGASPEITDSGAFRCGYALIGIPGIGAGNGIEAYNEVGATFPTANISTILIQPAANLLYTPIGLKNSGLFKNDGDAVFHGKVGIGTRTPSTALEVDGDLTVTGQIIASGNPVSVGQSSTFFNGGGLTTDNDGDTGIYSNSDDTLSLATANKERLTINSAGRVTVNQATGAESVFEIDAGTSRGNLFVTSSVNSNAAGMLSLVSTSTSPTINPGNRSLELRNLHTAEDGKRARTSHVNGNLLATGPKATDLAGSLSFGTKAAGRAASTTRMTITPTGNVGIGTNTPSGKLEVAGTARVRENLIVHGDLLNQKELGYKAAYNGVRWVELNERVHGTSYLGSPDQYIIEVIGGVSYSQLGKTVYTIDSRGGLDVRRMDFNGGHNRHELRIYNDLTVANNGLEKYVVGFYVGPNWSATRIRAKNEKTGRWVNLSHTQAQPVADGVNFDLAQYPVRYSELKAGNSRFEGSLTVTGEATITRIPPGGNIGMGSFTAAPQ